MLFIQIGDIYNYDIITIVMDRKAKTLLKVGLPLVIVIQLISITFLIARNGRDKAFSCKMIRPYLVCRQIELPDEKR